MKTRKKKSPTNGKTSILSVGNRQGEVRERPEDENTAEGV
jgi:hypothetical protein